ncbi:MAG: hypothetical protein OHK0021_11370 [Bryobacter sp.]
MPTLNVVVDQRFFLCPAQRVWTYSPPSYQFFRGCLEVFDRVRVIARATPVGSIPERANELTGPRLEFLPVPYYVGPWEYARKHFAVQRVVREATSLDGAFLFRIPSHVAFAIARGLRQQGRPFGVELLTDPDSFFTHGLSRHSSAVLFKPYFCRETRKLCSTASAVNYVSGKSAQRANPCQPGAWSDTISDVELGPDAFLARESRPSPPAGPSPLVKAVTAGALDHLVKGQDLLLHAAAHCHAAGVPVSIEFVGGGVMQEFLANLAARLGLSSFVHFTGMLPGAAAVRERFLAADIFALPSRAEGIPRALLEAMAAGLPSIGSAVGGIPDLLDPAWLVQPGNQSDLSHKLLTLAKLRQEWPSLGQRNQDKAREFAQSALAPRRKAFYEFLREATYQPNRALNQEVSVIHAA